VFIATRGAQVEQQSVTKIMSLKFVILVTIKGGDKHELLCNKLAIGNSLFMQN
jgi:hypothetical protein